MSVSKLIGFSEIFTPGHKETQTKSTSPKKLYFYSSCKLFHLLGIQFFGMSIYFWICQMLKERIFVAFEANVVHFHYLLPSGVFCFKKLKLSFLGNINLDKLGSIYKCKATMSCWFGLFERKLGSGLTGSCPRSRLDPSHSQKQIQIQITQIHMQTQIQILVTNSGSVLTGSCPISRCDPPHSQKPGPACISNPFPGKSYSMR